MESTVTLQRAYEAIFTWYRSCLHSTEALSVFKPFVESTHDLIEAMPEPDHAHDVERRAVLQEVSSGSLEWGYSRANELGGNGEIARAALLHSGGSLTPGEGAWLSSNSQLFPLLPMGRARALFNESFELRREGRVADADAMLDRAGDMATQLQDNATATLIAFTRAKLSKDEDVSKAAKHARDALELAAGLGDDFEEFAFEGAQSYLEKEAAEATSSRAPAKVKDSEQTIQLDTHGNPAFSFREWNLSVGTQTILRYAAGYSQQANHIASTTLVLMEILGQGQQRGLSYWTPDFFRQAADTSQERIDELRAEHAERDGYFTDRKGVIEFITPQLQLVMKQADILAQRTTNEGTIAVRHLFAVLIKNPAVTGGGWLLDSLRLDLPSLRERFFDWVRGYNDNDDEWRLYLLGSNSSRQRLTSFNADDSLGEDLLGTEQDVRALAMLIAAQTLSPPLSIGLFGDWGSGKTYFMKQLEKMIAQLSDEARRSGRPQKENPFFKHIVQIKFNAWHYVEGNLWASLVEHIFRNLCQTESTKESGEAMRKHWIEQLGFKEAALTAAQQQVAAAADRVIEAEKKVEARQAAYESTNEKVLTAKRVMEDIKLAGIPDAVIHALKPLGITPASSAAAEITESIRHARALIGHSRNVFAPLLQAKDKKRRWCYLALVIFGGAMTGFVAGYFYEWIGVEAVNQTWSFVTGTAATVTLGAKWAKAQMRWAREQLDRLEEANKSYEAALANERFEASEEMRRAEEQRALARAELVAAKQAADMALLERDAITKEIAEATPGRLLGRFVEDRAASSDYRKHLGVLAVIRDDFQKLSALIEKENKRLAELSLTDEQENDNNRVNRIVLYIDDLDRCPPNKVVEVLQAVHLLLAFPLFVVVVGVDSRWVSRSLELQYPNLIDAQAVQGVRSHDYLEKIFQIPLWLQPLDVDDTRRMIHGLLHTDLNGASANPQRRQTLLDLSPNLEPAKTTASTRSSLLLDTATIPAPTDIQKELETADVPPMQSSQTRNLVNVESLEIHGKEVSLMDQLAPLLGRSPRALKRFINVYRLIKAGLTDAELGVFMRNNGTDTQTELSPFGAVLFLLAVDTGLPSISQSFFNAVRSQNKQDWQHKSGDDLRSELEKFIATIEINESAEIERAKLMRWFKDQQHDPIYARAIPLMMDWVERVSRYSFQTDSGIPNRTM